MEREMALKVFRDRCTCYTPLFEKLEQEQRRRAPFSNVANGTNQRR